jgi:hypothetical protein
LWIESPVRGGMDLAGNGMGNGVAPLGLMMRMLLVTRGSRPWLHDVAPPVLRRPGADPFWKLSKTLLY